MTAAAITTIKVVRKALDHGVSHETRRVEEKFLFLEKKHSVAIPSGIGPG
jgi:hypothetical protein